MATVTIHESNTNLSKFIRRVQAGQTLRDVIAITCLGKLRNLFPSVNGFNSIQ